MNLFWVVSGRMRRALEGRENSDAVASCLEVVDGVVLGLMRDLMKDPELRVAEKGRLASCLSGVHEEDGRRKTEDGGRRTEGSSGSAAASPHQAEESGNRYDENTEHRAAAHYPGGDTWSPV